MAWRHCALSKWRDTSTMDNPIVACVRDADFGISRVISLRDAVARYLPRPYEMVCLTDQPERCNGVSFIDIAASGLSGWWLRMVLFEPQWRLRKKIIHLGLDVTVAGDLTPLAGVPGEFAIAGNFMGPCRYDSNAMVLGPLLGDIIWRRFELAREIYMDDFLDLGDACIEALYPDAQLLQRCVKTGFFRTNLIL
jgi:hypothetical protein